jgi:hypothetical protein
VVTITQPTSPVHTLAQMQREGDIDYALGFFGRDRASAWDTQALGDCQALSD